MVLKSIISVDVERCTGCRNCELACSLRKTGTFNPGRARIRIIKDETNGIIVPMVCLQCERPLCLEACPTGAIRPDDKGILYVEEGVCIGCGNCVTACVFGGIELDPVTLKAIKCDMCGGDPACVKACGYDALTVRPADAVGVLDRRRGMKRAAVRLGIEEVA